MRWSVVAMALVLGGGCSGEREGDDAGECSDGADNDLDGDFDCDDANCAGSPDCEDLTPTDPGTGSGTGTGTGTGTGSTNTTATGSGTGTGTGSGTGSGTGGGTGSGTGTGTGTGTGGTSSCGTISVFPTNGTIDAFYRTTIEAEVHNGLVGTETISVAGAPGSQVYDGDRVVFTPSAPLSPNTQYDATLSWTCGPTQWSFTTDATGAPVGPSGLVGSVYEFDLGNGRFVQPPGVGPLMSGFVEDAFLLGVLSANATTLDFRQAMGDGLGNQDTCAPTVDLTPADFTSDPYWQVGPTSIELDMQGVSLTLEDATWSGAFSPSKDEVTGGRLDATMDVSVLTPLIGSNPCALLVTFGVVCQPCPGGNVDCIDLEVDSIPAPRVSTTGLTPLTWPLIECDPACGTVTSTTCP